ncbi:DNA translocase FtsK [Legionella impletisoli]|uniref:DNA translocase FtsK n=2 Tax=Legionella impletisoli TaxID=343510 RepID=A0A917NB18_9GAMM|nr:DNA translocase FtsK [Legionella impletisoli]
MPHYLVKRISEGSFILVLTLAIYMLLSLMTYRQNDPGWTHSATHSSHITNAGGQVGAYISDGLYFCFGFLAFLIPVCFAYVGWIILKDHRALRKVNKAMLIVRTAGLVFLLCGGCGLLALELKTKTNTLMGYTGGIVGELMATILRSAFNPEGATLLLMAMLLVGITWLTGLSWVLTTEMIGRFTLTLVHGLIRMIMAAIKALSFWGNQAKETFNTRSHSTPSVSKPIIRKPEKIPTEPQLVQEPKRIEPSPSVKEKSVKKVEVIPGMPALTLLSKGQPGKPMGGYTHQELENLSRDVEQHLLDFGIQADVVSVHPGPVITRFELQLAAGVKVSKLTALSKDLARSLSVTSVRVVEIIPGKTVVGLELPNQDRATVSLSEVLSADVYQKAHSPLTLALGVDIAGHPMVVDLAKMPHLLVAGTTGSGKSVGINAMILSLLFKATPEQVRLIMVDPKMLELSVYDGIPHLLAPVVTDMKEAASALRWCVGEMERRYRLMASFGVRNLAGFNGKVAEAKAKGEPLVDPLWKPTNSATEESAPELTALPYIVVVIDELADMMMVVGKKVEQLIARIAQKARAAGIHLILATQRPSVDVLTGLIKSNIPTRISFQVSSKIDSRTILDQQGAEQLLGYGDMLFLAPGTGAPLRVHGAFVDDKEVHRVADDWRARGVPEYIDEITQNSGDGFDGIPGEEGQDTEEADPLYDQAVEFVVETRKASISAVQRRFKIGYNRAARLVEEMERTGLVGPLEGGFRDVLVNSIDD